MTRIDKDGFDLGFAAALVALGFALAIMLGARAGGAVVEGSLPRCPEDAVLVGTGDFEHGRYATYACGPAMDDYIGFEGYDR